MTKIFLLLLVPSLHASSAETFNRWKHFQSSTGFSVAYPSTWLRRGVSTDRLIIVSSKDGAEGMIVTRSQGNISVMKESASESLEQTIQRYGQDTTVLYRRDLHIKNAQPERCGELREVVSKEPSVPQEDVAPKIPPNFVRRMYFCQIDQAVFVTILTNVEGDVHQSYYRSVVLKVAESIHVAK